MSFPEIKMRRIGLTATAAILAFAIAGTAAAQSMVVRSTGPSASKYPTGTKLKSSDRVTLVAGDKVVLMQSGKTRTLSAPGTYSATGTVRVSQSMGTTVTRMIAKGPTLQSRGGITRSGSPEVAPADIRAPNLWLLDYREGGTFCVADPATLLFWRPDMAADTLLKIEGGGKSESVALIAGANYRRWPSDTLPLQYGVDYHMSGAGLAQPVTVRFTALDRLPETTEGSADILMDKGCVPQLNRLVDAMAEVEAAEG